MRLAGVTSQGETGAVAVEFALILPILMLFLFGVIQYGYGLFQLQSFSAAVDEAGRDASTGVPDCTAFSTLITRAISENGLSTGDLTDARLEWLGRGGQVTSLPEPFGQVRITATYRTFDIGMPGVPFPASITRSSTTGVQSVLNSGLTGCTGAQP